MNQLSQSTLAEFLRISLVYKLITIQDVITWADKTILESQNPDYPLLDLGLAADINHAISLLNQLAHQKNQNIDFEQVIILVLAFIKKRLEENKISYEKAVGIMYGLYLNYPKASETYQFLNMLDNTYHLAKSGYIAKTIEEVEQEIDEDLESFILPNNFPLN